MGGESNRIRKKRKENRSSVVKPRRSREDNIKADLKEIDYKHENWIHLAWNRT